MRESRLGIAIRTFAVPASNANFVRPGRRSPTNQLTQSLLSTRFFYGHRIGHYGMGRAMQVVYVFTFISVQLAMSTWWLSRYRFGPIEAWQPPGARGGATGVPAWIETFDTCSAGQVRV